MLSAKEIVLDKMKTLLTLQTNVRTQVFAEPSASGLSSCSFLWGRLDTKVAASYQPKTLEAKSKEELESYFADSLELNAL